jgi:hypothetical protein
MKTRKTIFGIITAMALFAIVTLAVVNCDNSGDNPAEQPQLPIGYITEYQTNA